MTKKKTKKAAKLTLCNFKISDEDLEKIQKNAKRFADGNLSRWLRASGKNYVPPKKTIAKRVA